MRFFFDCVCKEKVIFDYVGFDFPNSRMAVEFGREKLSFLKDCYSRDWAGWSIEISDPYGARLCSLPIDAPEMTVQDGFANSFIFPSQELH